MPLLTGVLSATVTDVGPSWLGPQAMIEAFGGWAVLGVALIIFAETGLLLGFFLPGDTLLFTTGLLAASGAIPTPLWLVVLALVAGAVAGGEVGYLIGKVAGRAVIRRTHVVRDDQVALTEEFFTTHGRKTLVLARFVPVVRALAPLVAGLAKMPRRTYTLGNVLGAALWAGGLTLLGAWAGGIPGVSDFVLDYLDYVLLGVVVFTLAVVGVQLVRQHRSGRRTPPPAPPADPPSGGASGPQPPGPAPAAACAGPTRTAGDD
jgi:membrane-associated protein